jgi:dolichyl-phosphate beta-glucosyltransferase
MTTEREVSLVVPVHHCNGSLARTLEACGRYLDALNGRCELVLVDDHGTDPRASTTLDRFAARRGDAVRLLRNDRNRGKGFSVKRGMLAANGQFRVFTDADLAYPLDEIWNIVAALQRGADIAAACRALPQSQSELAHDARYLYPRRVMSRAFNRLVRLTLLPGVLDTQAGLKGFTADAAREVFSRVSIPGCGFDLECLFVARKLGLRVAQVPVRFRHDEANSTVHFVRDALTMTSDLARIRWRALSGAYEAARH